MFFISARTPFGGSCRACSDLLGGNGAFTPQELKKMLQRSRVASRCLYVPKAISQVPLSKVGGDAV
jgi:hypothetical protein